MKIKLSMSVQDAGILTLPARRCKRTPRAFYQIRGMGVAFSHAVCERRFPDVYVVQKAYS